MSTLVEQVRGKFYTYAEAADALSVSKMTLWRWLKAGKLQGHRLGREVLIEKVTVDRTKAERQES